VANETAGSFSVLPNLGSAFGARIDYPAPPGPGSIALADFNGDGALDVVVSEFDADSVAVFPNQGDGTFGPYTQYETGTGPSWVAVADLNGDGKLDVATANYSVDSVSVLLDRGDGTFAPSVDYETGSSPVEIDVADVDHDGKPDLLTPNNDGETASVLWNGGDGSFDRRTDYLVGNRNRGLAPTSIAARDLNGDGKLDLAVAKANTSSVSVLLNTTGLCNVPSLRGKTLAGAKHALRRSGCRLGKVTRARSSRVRAGRVISQTPGPGAVRPHATRVDLVVSRG
jgi:VCBS repeat protein/PASTA domain-containing protein